MDSDKLSVLNVQALIDERKLSIYQWIVFILCFLIVALDGFDTAAIGYIAPSLISDLNIANSALGPVMSAAVVGLVLGSLIAGPLADRFGRKRILILAAFFFGIWNFATAFSDSLSFLIAFRFLTGLGLGAAMPNAVTLMSEYSPQKRRAVIVNAMFCGFPIGASLGGLVSAWMIPSYGWQSILILGGVLPLILSVVFIYALPESLRYLVIHNKPVNNIRKIVKRITGEGHSAVSLFTINESAPVATSSITTILSVPYRIGTLMLWLATFMSLLIFYLLTSWMPTIMTQSGFSIERATLITALFPLGGGIGAIFSGWMMDRFNPTLIVAGAYLLTALLIFGVGYEDNSLLLQGLAIFLAGTVMNGAQSSMPTLAADFYPTQGRATGVAWTLGIGRFGGIAGAYLGAELMRLSFGIQAIFTLLTIPALIASVALVIKYYVASQKLK